MLIDEYSTKVKEGIARKKQAGESLLIPYINAVLVKLTSVRPSVAIFSKFSSYPVSARLDRVS